MKNWTRLGFGIGCIVASAGACAVESGEPIDSQDDSIRLGTPYAPLFESVVLVETYDSNSNIVQRGSGIIMSPEWVLTAGHVIDGEEIGGLQPIDNTFVIWGAVDDESAPVSGITARYFHPKHVRGLQSSVDQTNVDVALLRVDPPFTGAPTRTLFSGDPRTLFNVDITCFGYGYQMHTSAGEPSGITGQLTVAAGLRVTGTGNVIIQAQENALTQIPIMGDSGGPCMAFPGATPIYGVISSSVISPEPRPHHVNVVHAKAFRTWAETTMGFCPDQVLGGTSYCSDLCPCNEGSGDCDHTSAGQCGRDLVCDDNVGAAFGHRSDYEICVPEGCEARVFGESEYCTADCKCGHGGGDCDPADGDCMEGFVCDLDVGRAYNMPTGHDICVPVGCETRTIGSTTYCSPACKCGHGGGDCDTNADCMQGLRCVQDNGAQFGYPAGHDVCVP
jgi:hypothetical protein